MVRCSVRTAVGCPAVTGRCLAQCFCFGEGNTARCTRARVKALIDRRSLWIKQRLAIHAASGRMLQGGNVHQERSTALHNAKQ